MTGARMRAQNAGAWLCFDSSFPGQIVTFGKPCHITRHCYGKGLGQASGTWALFPDTRNLHFPFSFPLMIFFWCFLSRPSSFTKDRKGCCLQVDSGKYLQMPLRLGNRKKSGYVYGTLKGKIQRENPINSYFNKLSALHRNNYLILFVISLVYISRSKTKRSAHFEECFSSCFSKGLYQFTLLPAVCKCCLVHHTITGIKCEDILLFLSLSIL